MPSTPIELIRARVARARSLTELLRSERERFASDDPDAVTAEEGPEGASLKLTISIDEKTLDGWSIIYSDALHNLRSALDNIVYSLWDAHSGLPAEQGDIRRIGFPIYVDATKYCSRSASLIDGVSPAADSFIESEQPYHRRHAPTADPLWVLHQLGNLDKHRAPRVVAMSLDVVEIDAGSHGSLSFPPPAGPQTSLYDGAEIGELRFASPVPPGTEMQVDVTVLLGIAYNVSATGVHSLLPIAESLEQFTARVGRIVEHLAGGM